MCTRQHKTLSLKERLELISEAPAQSKSYLCTKYKCSLATVNRILRKKNEVQEKSKLVKLSTQRQRCGKNEKVEKALKIWFDQIRASGGIVSTAMIKEKAEQLAVALNESFTPSAGWLWRWQNREGLKVRKLHGEGQSADIAAGEEYKEVIKHIISKYNTCDIFNADESGLFYKALPSSTLTCAHTELRGTKSSKERLTILFVCNATGEYKKCFIIGKSRNPRCFKNKIIPVKYYSNSKAWMTGEIWAEIMHSFNEEMIKLKRKIVLFVDNAAVHKKVGELSNIQIEFLPPNTTSITQPLDQGIIHSFKAHYRRNLVRKQIAALECGQTICQFTKAIDIFKALHLIKNSWASVQPICITNCFKKAGVFHYDEINPNPLEGTDPVIIVDETFNNEYSEYIDFDNNEPCYGLLSDSEIAQEVLNELTDEEEPELVLSPKKIPVKDLLMGIELLREHFLPENKFSSELDLMEANILFNKIERQKQTEIPEFFHPNEN